jgi:F-type H+-transporting ATPase subunit b
VQIDYFTIIAQIVNFLILIFILKHFLYGRVIKAMDQREQEIASRLKEAEQNKKVANEEADSYLKMKQELFTERQEYLTKVEEEVRALRTDLIKEARVEIEESKVAWYESVEHQKDALISDLSQQTGKEIYIIVRRALKDLANNELEHQIIVNFIELLQNMKDSEKTKIKNFYKNSGQKIIVRSAFGISGEIRQRIQEVVEDQIDVTVEIEYRIAEELIAGIDLSTQDLRIGWNVAGYLDTLEADLTQMIEKMIAEGKTS